MPRSRAIFLAFIVASLGGCGQDPNKVYVDLAKADELHLPALEAAPQPPIQTVKSSSVSIPASAPRDLYLGANKDRLARAEAVLAENQRLAFKEVSARLKEAFALEIDHIEAEQRRKLKQNEREELAKIYEGLRIVFVEYAQKIGQRRLKLAALVGVPDPDPQSLRPPISRAKESQRRWEEAKSLRGQIKTLDEEFRKEVATRRVVAQTKFNSDLTELAAAISEMRVKRDLEAEAEAVRMTTTKRNLQIRESIRRESIPAEPGASATLQSFPPRQSAPQPSQERPMPPTARLELDIWLSVKHYQLVGKQAGRDATQEFLAWRKQFKGSL